MEWIAVPLVALLASGLTLFPGFGLGNILNRPSPCSSPLPVAVATAAALVGQGRSSTCPSWPPLLFCGHLERLV